MESGRVTVFEKGRTGQARHIRIWERLPQTLTLNLCLLPHLGLGTMSILNEARAESYSVMCLGTFGWAQVG